MKNKLFSERHERAIFDKKIRIGLRVDLRNSLLRLLRRYSTYGGYDNEDNFSFEIVSSEILDRRGWRTLQWWDGSKFCEADGFQEFIEKGTPHHVLDSIELFINQLDQKKIPGFVYELNTIFELHHSRLRYFRGEFYVIDSAFIESSVLVQAQQLLGSNKFIGALDEFLQARSAYLGKDFKRTILMANHAFESTLKGILGVEKRKTAELIKRICREGVVPAYYEKFMEHFIEFLNIVPITRDNESGHGQGKEVTSVPPALAELALHLSGSLIVFLIKRHIEKKPTEPEEDIPF